MDISEVAALLSRWFHIFFAAVAVGGVVMTRFALAPAAQEVSGDQVTEYRGAIRRRWVKWVMAAIGVLLISGLLNFLFVHNSFKSVGDGHLPKWYHAIFGTKVLLAMAVFYISSLLVGKSESAQRIRKNEKRWLTINFVLMVAIICLAGVLRLAHNSPTPVDVSLLFVGGIYG